MKALFIAPIPPPINGQSLASKVFLDELETSTEVYVVDLSRTITGGVVNSILRLLKLIKIYLDICICRPASYQAIYFTISESLQGNVKDMVIYLLCYRQLDRMTVHLHGGANMQRLMNSTFLSFLNNFFLRKVKNIIVLGETQHEIFQDPEVKKKLKIIPNFSEDYLFMKDELIFQKHQAGSKINLLYLSNLVPSKGYMELLEAYYGLPASVRKNYVVHFAGEFSNGAAKEAFFRKAGGDQSVVYHGVVKGEEKRKLFHSSQVFCLPTYFPFEGQPISILEAYASGCVVITTNHSGIKDIFTDGVNGYQVEKRSVDSLKVAMIAVFQDKELLHDIAVNNKKLAQEKFTVKAFTFALKDAMEL